MKEKEGDVKPPTKMKIKDNNLEDIIAMLRYVNSMEIKRLKKAMQEQFSKSNKESEQVGFKTIWNEKYQREIIELSYFWGILQLLIGFQDSLNN